MLRRLTRIESQVWDYQMAEMQKKSQLAEKDLYGQVYPMIEKTLARLQHRINSFDRSYRAALRDLQKLQGACFEADAEPQPGPAPSPQPLAPEPACPQIGFLKFPQAPSRGPFPPPRNPCPPPPLPLPHPRQLPAHRACLARNPGLSSVRQLPDARPSGKCLEDVIPPHKIYGAIWGAGASRVPVVR